MCDITSFRLSVDITESINVFVIRPNNLSSKKLHSALVFAHGGGGFKCDAEMEMFLACRKAVDCQCIVFNVDYRLAPEYKCPAGTSDFYKTIKHVYKNA